MEVFELVVYVIIEICCALFANNEKSSEAGIAQTVSGYLLVLILVGFVFLLFCGTR